MGEYKNAYYLFNLKNLITYETFQKKPVVTYAIFSSFITGGNSF